ncbi:endo-beta-N-acetylglucosaminidase [Saccharibacillus alkalitolerans]|uniref:PKD domain-containing protein n=1 Tax=Saccharibacillus alkalitolerans TaxID=2705290 RepID=A0ABX0FE01_9BACL|nr:discoidin domain-containing protein [Saccharibacillus alkalitolerans]NGZ78026.1 PKD domain-containing protein [Saccharibacillus alkalitolerans]
MKTKRRKPALNVGKSSGSKFADSKLTLKPVWKKTLGTAAVALLAFSALSFGREAEAAQPHSSYWYPNTLLEWSPSSDPDAPFNRGSIPLQAKRIQGAPVNPNADKDAQVIALSAMYPSTSGAPSQGSDVFHTYAFGFWQYVDKLVMWGGSAGEGIILPPSADVIDAAHKNGVPVYGTVFLPQTEHGGKIQWMRDMLKKDSDGTFPVADKLIESARYYGFDGWFINQETQGGTAQDAADMQDFLKYLQQIKDPDMEILWYDSMIESGPIRWQGALNGQNDGFFQQGGQTVSDAMFLDFRWQSSSYLPAFRSSPAAAEALGRSPYDLFAGIDVEANGYNGRYNWPELFPAGGAPMSLGLYRPDWAFKNSSTQEEFLEKDETFWTGPAGDPSRAAAIDPANPYAWRGIAADIADKSVVTGPEFITHFGTGNGRLFAVNGEIVREREWSSRSLQDILPTWRWMIRSEGDGKALEPSLDFERAYYGGSSLKVEGGLVKGASTTVNLYRTQIPVEKTMEISAVVNESSKNASVQIGVSFAEAPNDYVFLEPKNWQSAGKDKSWQRGSVKLNAYKGRTIAGIALKFGGKAGDETYRANIGELAVRTVSDNARKPDAVTGLAVTDNDFRDGIYGDARLKWNAPAAGESAAFYRVYREKANGARELVGETPNTVYYVPELRRAEGEEETTLIVAPVNRHYEAGKESRVSFEWPAYPAPQAGFEADRTLIAPGETVRFADRSSEVTTEWSWSFPGGAPSSSGERNPSVVYNEPGEYEVTLIAKNRVGEDTLTRRMITVTEEAAGGVTDLARGADVTASGFTNANEAPPMAVDGDDKTKWCAVGDGPHTLTVDLGEARKISEFVLKHAETGGEPAAFNTRAFTLRISDDGENWTDAVKVTDNASGLSKHAIPLTSARYVRLVVDKPTQGGDTAARIYALEVMGLE